MLAGTLAFGLGGRAGVALSPSVDLIVRGYSALVTGLVLAGALQWPLLRGLISSAGWWVASGVAAALLTGAVAFGAGAFSRDAGWVLGVLVGWVALGVLQWRVLRDQVEGAGWWVLANTLGLVAAVPTVGFVSWASGAQAGAPLGALLRWLAFGAGQGAVTATALLWLLRRRGEPRAPEKGLGSTQV